MQQRNKLQVVQKSLLCHLETLLEMSVRKITSSWKEYHTYLHFLLSLNSYIEKYCDIINVC